MEREGWQIKAFAVAAALLVAAFVVWPLLSVASSASLAALVRFFDTPYFVRPFFNSIVLASAVSAFGTLVGFALAYAVERARVPGRGAFDSIFSIPLVAPPFLVAIAAIMLFGRNGVIVRHVLGGREPFAVYGFWGLFITEALAYFPTAYLILKGTLASINPTFEEAARSLGASRWRAFWKITAPLALPGILCSALILFIESLADFGNPLILSGSYQVLSVQAYLQITALYDIGGGAALAVMLLLPTLAAFIIQRRIARGRSFAVVSGKAARARRRSSGATVAAATALSLLAAFVIILFYGMILIGAFTRMWGADASLTLANFAKGLRIGWQYVSDSVLIAAAAAPAAAILGIAIAYLVERKRFRGRRLLEFSSMLAFAVPGTVIGIGYCQAFSEPHWFLPALTGTAWIIWLLFVFRSLPIGLQAGQAALKQLDPSIEEAARSLGAGPIATFARVILPLIAQALIASLIHGFIRAMTQISAVIFVVSGRWNLLTVFLLGLVENGELSVAAAMGVVLVAIVMAALIILKLAARGWGARIRATW